MPFIIRKSGPDSHPFCVFTQGEDGDPKGDSHGCHATEAEAQAQQRALYANVPDARKAAEFEGMLSAWDAEAKALVTGQSTWQAPGDTSASALVAPGTIHGDRPRFPLPVTQYQCASGHMHDTSTAALHCTMGMKADTSGADLMVFAGGTVKALGGNRVGGQLVTKGGPGDRSAYKDVFEDTTDYIAPMPQQVPVMYFHGSTKAYRKKCLGVGTATRNESGVWIEAPLEDPELYAKAERGELAWSSAAAHHTVDREPLPDGRHRVLTWLISEASLAPREAVMDPRNGVCALKAMITDDPDAFLAEKAAAPRRSLAERTELLTEDLSDLVAGYQQVGEAELKAGRPQFSAPRRQRLKELRDHLDRLLAETAPREERQDAAEPTEASPGMGAGETDPQPSPLAAEFLRLKVGLHALRTEQASATHVAG